MRAKTRHHHRPAVAVVAGIVDVLHPWSHIDSTPNVYRVIGFDDVLPAVAQPSVAQKKTKPAVGQIFLVILLDAIGNKGNASAVLLAMPQRALGPNALIKSRINLSVSKRFGLSVVPSPARKRRKVPRETLFHVDAKAIFPCDVPGMVGDFRH